jgi:DNA-directed RNA polymerase II subunit RPB1
MSTIFKYKTKRNESAQSFLKQALANVEDTGAAAAAGLGSVPSNSVCMPKKSSSMARPTMSVKEMKARVNINKNPISSLPELFAESVSISTMSPEEIKRIAVTEVNKPLFVGPGSVNDPLMGSVEPGDVCLTCGRDGLTCIGHYGYIKLNEPIINPLAIRELIRVLKSVCNNDGKLLVPLETLKSRGILALSGIRRLEAIEVAMEQGYECIPEEGCTRCKTNPHFDVTRSQERNMICYTIKKRTTKDAADLMEYNIKDVQIILEGISKETYKLLGFTNGASAENFVMTYLPVIPNCARRPSDQDGNIWHDDITRAYLNIVKVNNQLESTELREDERQKLVFQLIDLIKGIFLKSIKKGKQDKSFQSKLQGKEALPRANMMGKRVDYSGRTVISPDPSLKFGQVRVPWKIARTITKPVRITWHNRSVYQRLLESGRGINHIIPGPQSKLLEKTPDALGKEIVVNDWYRENYKLQLGDQIRRWLRSGDIVVINRQPTLSKYSWLAMEAVVVGARFGRVHSQAEDEKICTKHQCKQKHFFKIIDEGPKTFGLNLSYTTPFNADFDGDEMNIHVPQNELAEAEVSELMNVKACIMSDQTNQNALGVVYNAVTGSTILSVDGMFVDSDIAYDAMFSLTWNFNMIDWERRCNKRKIPIFSGKGYYSMLFPPDFYYSRGGVEIREGVLIKGIINKSHIGPSAGSIVQSIWYHYGKNRAAEFITDCYFIIDRWMISAYGFSISLSDCNPQGESQRLMIQETIEKAKLMAESLAGPIKDPLEQQRRERDLIAEINNVSNLGNKILNEQLSSTNPMAQMVKAGTKGKGVNVGQIAGLIGQQFLDGQRLQAGLAYFDPNDTDTSLESRGFIKSSFTQGMTPSEMVQHQASGRLGLINTGLTTADSGAEHHNIIKQTEDISTRHDNSVRNTYGVIFSFAYGGDGMDAAKLQKVKIRGIIQLSPINMQEEALRLNGKYGYA